MKAKKILTFLIISCLICACFAYIPSAQAVFNINPTVRNGSIYVNGSQQSAKKIATFCGAPYVPLNIVSSQAGITYDKNSDESIISFSYKGNTLKLNFNTKETFLNEKKYDLLHGVSKMDISGETHIFIGSQDIQNIFGIIIRYDENTRTINIDTGFGVIAVDYSQERGYQEERIMADRKTILHSYTSNIASKVKGSMTLTDKTYVESQTEGIIESINSPITIPELKNGIKIRGLSYKNTSAADLEHIMEIRFIASLANITVSSEYVRVYEVNSHKSKICVVGMLFTYEGLEISDDDLVTATIASIEDTLNAGINKATYDSVSLKVKTITNNLRRDSKMLICVIQNGEIIAAGLK